LNPGERTTVKAGSNTAVKEEVTDKLYNYYRTKEFVCDDTPLWKLVDVINEAYDVNIQFKREELKQYKINTPFINQSLDQVLEVIQETFPDIKMNKKDNLIILEYFSFY
jgi:transmembrane sensor